MSIPHKGMLAKQLPTQHFVITLSGSHFVVISTLFQSFKSAHSLIKPGPC